MSWGVANARHKGPAGRLTIIKNLQLYNVADQVGGAALNSLFDQNFQIFAVIAVVAIAAFGILRRRQRGGGTGDGALLSMALNNMTQGVIMFDDNEHVAVCNDRYVEMYGLSPNVVKPGGTLMDLINNRITTGSLNIDAEKYRAEIMTAVRQGQSMNRIVETPDGRAVLVVNRPIKGGQLLDWHA